MKKVPKGNKGLAKLPTAVRNKMGYMMDGGEKMLMKMTYGGSSMDMSDPMVKRMQMGGSTHSGKSTPISKTPSRPSTKRASKVSKARIQDGKFGTVTSSRPTKMTKMRMSTPNKKK